MAIILALLVAATVVLTVATQRPELPSERWYRLPGQQLMQADLAFRFGVWLAESGGPYASPFGGQARLITEQAVAAYERQALVADPNPKAVYRLGVIYGHRGYREQAERFLTWATSLDADNTDLYYALSEVYSPQENVPREELQEHARALAGQAGWLADLTLVDCYKALGDDKQVEAISARAADRARRFGVAISFLVLALLSLLALGVILLARAVIHWGLRLPVRRAELPFIVPWTLLDVAEVLILLPFALAVTAVAAYAGRPLFAPAGQVPLAHPLLVAAQYCVAVLVCLAVIFRRVRARSSRPLRSLGLRAGRPLRLIAAGIGGYGVLICFMVLLGVALQGLTGDSLPLAQTAEDLIGDAGNPGAVAIYFVLVCVIAPMVEETIFRGYVYAGIRRFMTPRLAMVAAGLLFAGAHLSPDAMVVITLIGIVLCYLYERTRSLLPGMIAHALHNGIVFLAIVAHSI